MSRSGVFIRTQRAIGLGSATEIALDLPGEQTLHLMAQVVRVADDGMGLRFVDQDRTRRSLANFIMRQHATSR